jgi:hypothetical protein
LASSRAVGQEVGALVDNSGSSAALPSVAWASPNTVGFNLQLFKATSFEREKLHLDVKYS